MSFFEVRDPVFNSYVIGNAPPKQIANGFLWTEGPVWFGDSNQLLFSDIPNNRIMRWTPESGVSVFRSPSNYSNGHTRDREGRLISCEHGMRRVTRTELDGKITVIADSYEGKKLNSPNDVVVKSDDTIWFTDPHYGIMTNYEGFKSDQELPCHVYRVEPKSGSIDAVATDFQCPNGLAFSQDESILYVSDTGTIFDPEGNGHIRKFNVSNNELSGGEVFYDLAQGKPDGFRIDQDGNIWTSAGDGVHCVSPAGKLLGKILIPEVVSNVCFGGRAKHQLFITSTTSVHSVILNREGIQSP